MGGKVECQGGVRILRIEGELSGSRVASFIEAARGELAADARDFVVDMAEASGVSSAGLEALTWLKRECEERLGLMKLCAVSATVGKVLELTRLDRQLDACAHLDEAMAGFA